jgi:hypothetical protein
LRLEITQSDILEEAIMRNLLVAATAVGVLLGGGAAFAQSGQGGYLGTDPSHVQTSPPAQGTGGPGNTTYSYPGTTNSGSAGVGATGGQGNYPNPNPQVQNQGDTTYGVPGKVGGGSPR